VARARHSGRKLSLEDELARLSDVAADPESPEARARLVEALGSARSFVVARAATIIKDARIDGLAGELTAAFARMLEEPVKRDPGCHAKTALLDALDLTESMDEEPFLRGARHVQTEPGWPRASDAAAPVRARAVMALGRIGTTDMLVLAGEMLADPEPVVRHAVVAALAHHGARAGAGLALHKLRLGDEEPLVVGECMKALLALAPDYGIRELRPLVLGVEPGARELAALALGESRREDALALLCEALELTTVAHERKIVFTALALHRSERALDVLLEVVRAGRRADANAALRALAIRRFDPGVAQRVRAAVAENSAAPELRESLEQMLAE